MLFCDTCFFCTFTTIMIYVDVILPLPLEGLFTYSVPPHLESRVQNGMRVQVPLGKTKTYTAVVACVHDDKGVPENSGKAVVVRDILAVLDSEPVVLDSQLRLWQWIADYYMSPIGDVMKAALPPGMKHEEGWRPKTESCVILDEAYRNERSIELIRSILKASKKQLEVFECYLRLSNITDGTVDFREVSREELMNESHCSSAVMRALLDRPFMQTYNREVGRLDNGGMPHPERIKPLSDAQADAYNQLLLQMMKKQVTLLHGVTSSGKTEIYIHLIQKTIEEGRQVLYLVPEIALTVQLMERLQLVFGNRLGIYHSKYSDAQRVEIWKKQLSKNPYDIILGARSACLLPFQKLGLVITDEEHETSFKQLDPAPRYHARSVAIMMGQEARVKEQKNTLSPTTQNPSPVIILGTATPCAETYYNAMTGKYGYVCLSERYKGVALPEIHVVDVKDLRRRKMMNGPFSPILLAAMRQALDAGEQVILFQNRRGFAPMMECKVCGWVPKCDHCDVSLTLHKSQNFMSCHYCGRVYKIPDACPACESRELMGRGYGTEKIEDQISMLFPNVKVARMDLDTTHTRSAYARIISDFSAGKTQILIGTQMVTKGLDFDNVSVVGILDADTMLNYPDFRANEYAFTMLSQVAGRAGRRGKRGLVILQTKSANQPVVQQVVRNDYKAFFRDLVEERHAFQYPPFYRLINVFLKHRYEDVVGTAALEMSSRMREIFGERVLGPDRPAISRVNRLHIRKIVLKLENGIDHKKVREYLHAMQSQLLKDSRYGALQIYYDVDPV